MPVDSIKVVDAQGTPAAEARAYPATGHKLRSASLLEAPGRYTFEATVDGHHIKRTITLRPSHTYSVKLIEDVP